MHCGSLTEGAKEGSPIHDSQEDLFPSSQNTQDSEVDSETPELLDLSFYQNQLNIVNVSFLNTQLNIY